MQQITNIEKNNRTFVLLNESQPYSFKMKYAYDSWKICASRVKGKLVFCSEAQPNLRVANRVQDIVYPDGEKVSYAYSSGGMLKSISGRKGSVANHYIDSIRYNQFEQKAVQWNGNGTHTHYSYDILQRLSNLVSVTSLNEVMQEITYTYDAVSNITQIVNGAGILNDGMGGTYENTYQYDSLYRLTQAEGVWRGADTVQFQLNMAYLPNGRIHRKNLNGQVYTQTPTSTTTLPVIYDHHYNYGNTAQPNTVTSIGQDTLFSWDATGNMVSRSTVDEVLMSHCWDEQNRLQGAVQAKDLSLYLYDGGGERFFKVSGSRVDMNVNGVWSSYYALENATLYASSYLVVTPKGYTKHYYADAERIASRIGGGKLSDIEQAVESEDSVSNFGTIVCQHYGRVANCLNISNIKVTKSLHSIYSYKDSVKPEDDCYWYHPDHLGSSSWITGSTGKPVEHLHYLPWGENFVHQRNTDFQARYTFSAKEKDEITGYSYFGARYHNSALSIWLSVDPMSDKYPGVSPYTYCANNPVRLVDPNGEEIVVNTKGRKETKQIMKRYFCEHFGSSDLFRFKPNGTLAIRRSNFNKALAAANCEQEQLLLGMQEVIQDKNHTAEIRISNDICKELPMQLSLCTGENPDRTQKVESVLWNMPVEAEGGGCTMYSKTSDRFFIGISDALSNHKIYTTGKDGVFTGSGSSTFFHEVLDEFLNFYIRGNTTDQSPKIDKVSFQNAALKNQGLPLRDGADHQ